MVMSNRHRAAIALMMVASLGAAELSRDERDVLASFDQELAAYAQVAATARAARDNGRLVRLASERRAVMHRLVRQDPAQAVALALDRQRRKNAPAAVQAELEEDLSASGRLDVIVSRSADTTEPPIITRRATIAGKSYEVSTWGPGLRATSAARRSLHGVAVDGVLALAPGRLRVLKPGEAELVGKPLDDQRCPVSGKLAGSDQEPEDRQEDVWVESGGAVHVLCQGGHITQFEDQLALAEGGGTVLPSAWTTGTKSLLYIIARCSDEVGFPQTVGSAETMMATVKTYYETTSWNQTSLTSSFIEVVLPKTKNDYATGSNGDMTLLADARAAAKDAGMDPANYNLDVVRHSSIFGWAGQGYVGGKGSWLQSSSAGVAIHELGHNYGLWHANFWNTGEASVIGSGSNAEYGDPFSEMGGDGQFSAYEKWRLDWIAGTYVQAITASGTYRVHASDSATAPASGKMFALKVTKDAQRDYWLSHRREFTGNKWNLSGLHLHWDPWSITGVGTSNNGAQLLDATPGTSNAKNDAALVCGRTFSDLAAGIHLTPMTVDTGTTPPSVTVVVNLGSFPGNRRPTVSLAASASAVATNANVTFTATASDPDGDPLAIHWDFADGNFAFNSTTATKSWGTAKDYSVRVIVSDMKGGTASATATITVGTVSTFRISGVVRDGGVGVEGVRVHTGSTARSVWTNSDGSYVMTNLGAGSHTLQATAQTGTYTPDFTNPVAVGPDATGKHFNGGNAAPTVATPAAASPSPVIAKTTTLSALGADDGGEAALTYTWTVLGSPPAPVTFSANGSNAAKSTTATFTKNGPYDFRVTIRDAGGLSVTSSVSVSVNQTVTTVSVTPASATVALGSTQAFSASAKDQFGAAMAAPTFTWSVSGGGSISAAGVFTPNSTPGGSFTVTATGAGKSGTAQVTTINSPPTISAIADQATQPGIAVGPLAFTIGDAPTAATSLTLTATSSNAALVPVGNVVFGGSAASRTVTVTPVAGQQGTSTITIAVKDGHNASTTEAFLLTVGTAGSGSGDGGGGGGGGCGLGSGMSALALLIGLLLQRLMGWRRSFPRR
jgi:hypothetical protein